ncbi:MAG: molybdopterin-dependent oxidoreductase [Roseobacter sp.]
MINIAAGVQRTGFGEQPLLMAVTLAVMLGQIGLPGGGYTVGYGANGSFGNVERPFGSGALSQLQNPSDKFLPVAMISEALLNAGGTYPYKGHNRTFPDTSLVWWAGGDPFHRHQDLNRLHDAFQTPDMIIVNEMNWSAITRHADIVLPVIAAQEQDIDRHDRDTFHAGDVIGLPDPTPNQVFLAAFRANPADAPLPTASGRNKIFSETIARFNLPDCPGHACWSAPRDRRAGTNIDPS